MNTNTLTDVFDLDVRIDSAPATDNDRRGAADGPTYTCDINCGHVSTPCA